MRHMIGDCALELTTGDITQQDTTVIVNAANSMLAGGGGVDGAIHRVGGPEIMAETALRFPNGCPTGSAVLTCGGLLRAKFVAHAVGPIWRGGREDESGQLKSAIETCLRLCLQAEAHSIAFPAISTGAYGFPADMAADISITTVLDFLDRQQAPELVRFVLFDAGAFGAFARALENRISAA